MPLSASKTVHSETSGRCHRPLCGAIVENIAHQVHIRDRACLCAVDRRSSQSSLESRYLSLGDAARAGDPTDPLRRDSQCGLPSEDSAQCGKRRSVEPLICLLVQFALRRE
jgi:hypothetical protein